MGSLPAFQIKGAREWTLFDGREKSIEDEDKKVTCFIFKRKEKSAKKMGLVSKKPQHGALREKTNDSLREGDGSLSKKTHLLAKRGLLSLKPFESIGLRPNDEEDSLNG